MLTVIDTSTDQPAWSVRFEEGGVRPMEFDVNGDGWTDLVSANYRSATLYWIEHPGAW